MTTRGERNNNPGNIERNETEWKGMAEDQSADPRFVVFTSPAYGIRAIIKILQSYHREGVHTLREVIERWAPADEIGMDGKPANDTDSYVRDMVRETGVMPGEIIDLSDNPTLEAVAIGLIHHENGRCIYDASTISEAFSLLA